MFFQGEAIGGFPPSPKYLAEKFRQHGLEWKEELYPFQYSTPASPEYCTYDEAKFVLKSYAPAIFRDVCRLCTAAHPYLDPRDYDESAWSPHEQKKEAFLHKAFAEGNVLGEVVNYETSPVGFIEAFPVQVAAQMGFAVANVNEKSIMITCLSLCNHVRGHGLAYKLIAALEDDARVRGFNSIEVLAFPDYDGWQPKSLYEKAGYQSVKAVKDWRLFKKVL